MKQRLIFQHQQTEENIRILYGARSNSVVINIVECYLKVNSCFLTAVSGPVTDVDFYINPNSSQVQLK